MIIKEVEANHDHLHPEAIRLFMAGHQPVKIKGLGGTSLLPKNKSLFSGDLDNLYDFTMAHLSDTVVDVACVNRGEAFSGDLEKAESVPLRFLSFVSMMKSHLKGEQHWGTNLEGVDLYLAQCPVYHRQQGACSPLEPLRDCLDVPSFLPLDRHPLVTINLWMNLSPVSSTLHYDSNHNLLVVAKGSKQVHLYSPSLTPLLKPRPLHSESANHSTLLVNDIPHTAQHMVAKTTIDAGDALYLPEGWWHQVDSSAGTVAVNYWFEGFVEGTLGSDEGHHAMLPFYLRSVLRVMIMDAKNQAITHAKAQSRKGLIGSLRGRKRGREGSGSQVKDPPIPWQDVLKAVIPQIKEGGKGVDQSDNPLDQVLQAMSLEEMVEELPQFVRAHQKEWVDMVASTSPLTVASLTWEWDHAVGQGKDLKSFFEVVTSPTLEGAEAIKAHLVKGQDTFASTICKQITREQWCCA